MLRPLDPTIAVAPQIRPEDVPAIAAAGYVAIVNNRPDGEEPGQPEGEAIRAAAEAAGLGYTAIPITHAGFSRPQVDAMTAALSESYGRKVVAQGQGGSIPLCGAFQRHFPDAEIMLMGVEEPRALIHAADESVDPSEIQHLAVAEAIFLERYR